MNQKPKTAIEPTRAEDYPEWYQQVVKGAELAEHSPVRGCMVIKPWGYAIWENMQRILDKKFKDTGHQNAYFPLFIPLSFLEKEAAHVEGFAKECAVVTHHRLEVGKEGKLVPAGALEEPLIVRPTSETIIGEMFSKWIASYRDLPLLINQWCNVVRWEMRTRLFLRTTEFLWQEGHTAHASEEEAREETLKMLHIYEDFLHNTLAIPVITGEKSASERFPGAVATYTIEAMMQDKKALQGGTSHFLGQNFAKAAAIRFQGVDGNLEHAWTTSWGLTTRLIGALTMVHGDDDGLVLPPRIASAQIVILPVIHKEETRAQVLDYSRALAGSLRSLNLTVIVDERDLRGGDKTWSWIKKGVPIRIEVGPRDIEADQLPLFRRNHHHKEKKLLSRSQLLGSIHHLLDEMQQALYQKALAFQKSHIHEIHTKEEFHSFFSATDPGFALCPWVEDAAVESRLKESHNVTIRCIPLKQSNVPAHCPFTGKPTTLRALWARSY